MTRPAFLGLVLALGFLAALVPSVGASTGDPCVTTPSGYTACGHVTIVGCGIASAQGSATGVVHWKFVVSETYVGTSTHGQDSIAYSHTTTLPCSTGPSCTDGALYADGVLVDRPVGICFS